MNNQNQQRIDTAAVRLGEVVDAGKAPYFVVNSNELPFPDPMPKYMVVELDNDHDPVWAFFVETLDEAAKTIDTSDTDCVSAIKVYDLDTGLYQLPDIRVAGFSAPTADKY